MNEARPSVAAALATARASGVARLDAQLMLARLMGVPRTWLIGHDDALLDAAIVGPWTEWLGRRAEGEPLAYLLGEKEFRGLMLAVTPAVLVPRPETELLVDWAGALLRDRHDSLDVLDLGTGSGAIALAIKHEHPHLRVTATDSSREALSMARGNALRLGLPIEFIETSWWHGLAGRRFDLVLANPPYVAEADPALDSLRHEPRSSLTPGGDGLGALETIVEAAAVHLNADSWLLLEHGFDQGAAVRGLLKRAGFADIETRADLAGLPRATGARSARAAA